MLQTGLHNKLISCYDSIKKALRVKIGDGANDVSIIPTNGEYGLVTIEPNHISTDNSTTDLLGIDGVFTGVSEEITNYSVMFVNVYSDVASATDGLCVQFSTDGVNWDAEDCYTIAANTGKTFSLQCATKFFRVIYTNGGVAQTEFRLQVKLCTKDALDSSHRIADSISDQDDATLVKSVLTALNPSNLFINVGATASGNLRTTNAEDGLAIAKGDVQKTTFVHKFGDAPDFDTGDGFVTIWDGADDGNANIMNLTYSTTADIDSIVSSNASDTETIEIQGLDINYDLVTQTATLNGQTRVSLSTSLIRVFRMKNTGSNDLVGRVSCYVNSSITNGIPDDGTKVRAIIENGNNQTLMAAYTIPNGYTGYMRDFYVSASSSRNSVVNKTELLRREFGGVFQVKHKLAINVTGSSYIQHKYEEPEPIPAKTDIEIRANTDTNVAGVSAGFDIVLVQD